MQEIKQPRGMGSASMGVECSFKCRISMEVTIQQKLKISHMYISSRGNVCQDKGNSYGNKFKAKITCQLLSHS